MNDYDIETLLKYWGIWARGDGLSQLDNTLSAMFSSIPSANRGEYLTITDDEAMAIEQGLSILKAKRPTEYLCLFLTYYYSMSNSGCIDTLKRIANDPKKCKKLGVVGSDLPKSRHLFNEKKAAGLAYVEACVCVIR